MVCSYGDQNDVALFRELKLEEVVAIGLDGRMTKAAGELRGSKTKTSYEQRLLKIWKNSRICGKD